MLSPKVEYFMNTCHELPVFRPLNLATDTLIEDEAKATPAREPQLHEIALLRRDSNKSTSITSSWNPNYVKLIAS
jgi:hypothetical protein